VLAYVSEKGEIIMLRKKDLMGIILAAVLLFSCVLPASAKNSEDRVVDKELIKFATSLVETAISDTSNELFERGEYALGHAIPTYVYKDGTVKEFEDAIHYPIFLNGNPIGVFTINGATFDDPTYSVSGDFMNGLAKVIPDDKVEFSLILTGNQTFAIVNDNAIQIAVYGSGGAIPGKTVLKKKGKNGAPDEVDFIPDPSWKPEKIIHYSADEIMSAISGMNIESTTFHSKTPLPVSVGVEQPILANQQPEDGLGCWTFYVRFVD
jgi:hypothetical protein